MIYKVEKRSSQIITDVYYVEAESEEQAIEMVDEGDVDEPVDSWASDYLQPVETVVVAEAESQEELSESSQMHPKVLNKKNRINERYAPTDGSEYQEDSLAMEVEWVNDEDMYTAVLMTLYLQAHVDEFPENFDIRNASTYSAWGTDQYGRDDYEFDNRMYYLEDGNGNVIFEQEIDEDEINDAEKTFGAMAKQLVDRMRQQ